MRGLRERRARELSNPLHAMRPADWIWFVTDERCVRERWR
jgi:hypothetical protein